MKVSCAIVLRDNKVLVQKRFRQGRFVYEFPMGKVDERESFEDAAIRELKEETGLESSFKELEILTNKDGIEIAFVTLSISKTAVPLSDESRKQEYFWFRWSDIPIDDFHEADREFIRRRMRTSFD